ncbi:MAG: UTP--glucose-1-phosphate uridylyltransferase [Caldilineaceae bacterium]|nr:UTP--glucose-1-phosphate uridylyltransferase [Caldilineaceae bacterium]
MSTLARIITAADEDTRNRSLEQFARSASAETLLRECEALDRLRRENENLYEQVRALFFLHSIHRYHLPGKPGIAGRGVVPFRGYEELRNRRFEEAIETFLRHQAQAGPSEALSSGLSAAYRQLGFQTLADQVRRSVRSIAGNQWMFRVGHPSDHPLRVHRRLLRPLENGLFPILRETTPVRMDLTHCGWSDIFFLGMDYPEGARVLNISIDLSVESAGPTQGQAPRPPVEGYFRVIDRPVLRLASVDLQASAEITTFAEVFDFARDHLGLLKAALIAAGIVPPGMEGAHQPLSDLLTQLVGSGQGIELVSKVNDIPKGSRLAVSTSLLACLITVCMRATGQAGSLTGGLSEVERRLVAARAILGEWLGGSGGGWQDSGGVWPGIKLIEGRLSAEGDPEFGVSRGRLLPGHHLFGKDEISEETRQALQASLVLVHGGMAQDVGPILEMVTEKYLLRSEEEWMGRQQAIGALDEILGYLKAGNIKAIGEATERNFQGPIQTIIPWAGNLYTDRLIQQARAAFGEHFWGFWMLGGMSGGGMGFLFDPRHKSSAKVRLQEIMDKTKARMEQSVPFAMQPVVYDFAIDERGTWAELHGRAGETERRADGPAALMPGDYYRLTFPDILRRDPWLLSPAQRAELEIFGALSVGDPALGDVLPSLFQRMLPQKQEEESQDSLSAMLAANAFDREQHEQIRGDLRSGRIGLAQNRLPTRSLIEEVAPEALVDATAGLPKRLDEIGRAALKAGEVAVVTLAGGAGSRWSQGAGVVKALNPFARLAGRHRNFIEIHLAKSRRSGRLCGTPLPHVITTSYLTHRAIADALGDGDGCGSGGPLLLSPGNSVGLRMVPMVRDLRFDWEESSRQVLDIQAEKVRESQHNALINWARSQGEGSDYVDNLPDQCIHPVGHWYELPHLLRNGVLRGLLEERPQLQYLMMHNIDTVGAHVDPGLLGLHISAQGAMTAEVIHRRLEDRGGGLARIDGSVRLVEGMALPREEIEFRLAYYNTNTFWIHIDRLLAALGLERTALEDGRGVAEALGRMAARMPTYVTLKEVKKRWGRGQEDIFPVTQFEKLWGDMTALPEMDCRYVVVPRMRGQQLKEVAQLDGWLRDGSAAYVEDLCDWPD